MELQSRNLTGLSSKDVFLENCIDMSLLLRMYDVDENGFIDLNEMTKLVRSIYQVSGAHQKQVLFKNQAAMLRIIFFVLETE